MARCFEPDVAEQFVRGSLPEDAFADVLAHAASCARCKELLHSAARPQRELPVAGLDEIQERLTVWRAARRSPLLPEAPLRKGDTVDRYVVIRSVGATEDGMIYEAFDPDREQRVVVKQLDVRVEDAAAVGLMAVARRLCRFSHPNVLQMLAVGAHAGAVYLVYEFVKGSPLSQLGSGDARTMLAMFAQAGRGLAAAHDIGISHGCFSAASCVVDREGHVKVLDFGVGEARIRRMAAASAQFDQDWPTTSNDVSTEDSFIGFVPTRRAPTAPFESFILAAGPSSLGPRRYAAPELLEGTPPSPASDQYAFCAALFHHLYRRPAFAGESIALWLREVLRGQLTAPPPQAEVPRSVYAVLQRGLRTDPAARFDRMSTLLGKLPSQRPLASRRTRTAVALAIGASAVAGVLVARGQRASSAGTPGSCDPVSSREWQSLLHREQGLLGAAGAAAATSEASRVKGRLGDWTRSWQRATSGFCQAPARAATSATSTSPGLPLVAAAGGAASGRAPPQLVRVCEGAARDAYADLLQLLEGDRRDRLDRAASAVEILPTAEQCAIAPASAAWPAVVVRAEVRRRLGMLAEAEQLLDGAPEGEALPELLWVRGQRAADRGGRVEARRVRESAVFAAQAAGEVTLSLTAAARRLSLACAAPERALWRGYLDAQLPAAGQAAPPAVVVKSALSAALWCEGDAAAAARVRAEVAATLQRESSPVAAAAALASAQSLLDQGDSNGAEAAALRATRLYEASYGAHHPSTQLAQLTVAEARLAASSLGATKAPAGALGASAGASAGASIDQLEASIDQVAADAAVRGDADAVRARAWLLRARLAGQRGEVERALEGTRKAVLEYEAALGGAHPELAAAVLELADRLLDAGRHPEAEAAYRQVAGIFETLGQGQSPQLAHARAGIQLAAWGARPPSDAGELVRWGVAPTGGDLDPRVDLWVSTQLARRFAARDDDERADAHYRRAVELAEQIGNPQTLATCSVQLALFAAERGRADARDLLEHALGLQGAQLARPRLQAALAKVLWSSDRPRARALAEQASAELGDGSAEASELRQWIKRHGDHRP